MNDNARTDSGQGQSILSDWLEALIDQFTLYLNVGMELQPEAVAGIIMILEGCRNEAKALEEAANQYFQGQPFPAEILKIAAFLHAHRVSRGIAKVHG